MHFGLYQLYPDTILYETLHIAAELTVALGNCASKYIYFFIIRSANPNRPNDARRN
jgi:hypothetical protein